ncbi:MAG: hypothetical protein WBA74_06680, partial [Cyclobacteriaceae bacterium]
LYLNDCSSLTMLECLTEKENLEVKAFYGHSGDIHFETSDVSSFTNMKDMKIFIENYEEYLVINKLTFELKMGIIISFNDDYECSIRSKHEIISLNLFENLMKAFNYSVDLIKDKLIKNQGKYILLDQNGLLIKSFINFDEYIDYKE